VSYWLTAIVLVGFGFVAGFSIGPPFFVVGVAMLILGPLRRWRRLFWPLLMGVIAFVVAVVLVIPLSCTASAEIGGASTTVCSSILGPTWSGTGEYNPPPEAFALAFRMGLVAGFVAAAATLAWLTLRRGGGQATAGPT
jgi:hypothetical protein